jgi:hypothetical protein
MSTIEKALLAVGVTMAITALGIAALLMGLSGGGL